MRNILTIAQRELKSYFASPIAYVLLFMFAALFGFFFWNVVAYFAYASAQQGMGRPSQLNVNEFVIRGLLQNVGIISVFLIPMVTMRLFAEEKRSGTIELLVTSPITDAEMAIGKWLAALLLFGSLLLISAVNFAFVFAYGNPDVKPFLVGYLGLLLEGGALLAIGTFISTTTRNQIIAGGITFCVCLLFYVFGFAGAYENTLSARVLQYLSITNHYESFAKGVLELKDVVYYFSLIFFGLFLTTRSIESMRWRA